MLVGLEAKHLLEGLAPHVAQLAHIAHLHGQWVEPHEARLANVAALEEHLGAHEQGQLGEIGAHTLGGSDLGRPLQVGHHTVAIAYRFLLVGEWDVGVAQGHHLVDVLGIEAIGLRQHGALWEAIIVTDVLGQEFLLHDHVIEDMLAIVERGQQALLGVGPDGERLGHLPLAHTLHMGVGRSKVDGKGKRIVALHINGPSGAHHTFAHPRLALIGKRHRHIIEALRQAVIVGAHTLLALQRTRAFHGFHLCGAVGVGLALVEGQLQMVVLQQAQRAIHQLDVVLLEVAGLHKGENAHGKGHGEEIATIAHGIVTHVDPHGGHIGALQGDEVPRLLHRHAQNGLHRFLLSVLGVHHLEAWTARNGSHEVLRGEVFEVGFAQRQEEVVGVGLPTAQRQVAVEEAIAVHRVVELDERRLEEVVGREPRILMCGGGQDALLGLHGIVGGLDGDKIVPVGGDIPEGVGLRCVELVLQHQRQPDKLRQRLQ